MKIVDYCLICGNRDLTRGNAIVVPFIAERVFQQKSFHTWLLDCRTCGFKFFSTRFDDDELGRLYSGYRDENYFLQRNKYEPWYTRRLNDSLINDPESWNVRRKTLAKVVEHYEPGIEKRVKSILDYGGYNGELIDGIFGDPRRCVYEIANVRLLAGIDRAQYPSNEVYDLIVCSNVLEHVSYPQGCIRQIYEMAHAESVLYLEIPNERPHSIYTLAKRIAQLMLLFCLRPQLFRSIAGAGMLTHMHEHMNYFSERSIQYLLQQNGFVDVQVTTAKDAGCIRALARRGLPKRREIVGAI